MHVRIHAYLKCFCVGLGCFSLIARAHEGPLNTSGLLQLFRLHFPATNPPVEMLHFAECLFLVGRNCSQFPETLVEMIHRHLERVGQTLFAQGIVEICVGRCCVYAHPQHVGF